MLTDLAPVNFNCPSKLLDEFDRAWRASGRIPSRTAALHRAMEQFIKKNKPEGVS